MATSFATLQANANKTDMKMTQMSVSSNGLSTSDVATISTDKKCAVCFVPSTSKCARCSAVAYCGRDHQKLHWKTHKAICKDLKQDKKDHKTSSRALQKEIGLGKTKVPYQNVVVPSASWSSGLVAPAKYEWLVDCYRMRVDDDYHYGRNYHGIAADGDGSKITNVSIATDFLIFCKLAQLKGVIPTMDWEWSRFLAMGTCTLTDAFSKADAIHKYGGENYFDGAQGKRSLRYTGELVYGTAVDAKKMNDANYLKVKGEVHEHILVSERYLSESSPIKSEVYKSAEFFEDIGGLDMW
eukprot:CAMPEP_0175166144 /NCGR_PEP_ID=MMETSP0087-20121206/27525_1 /TAXON_ID=136419 /ORGANISM="Unknown Unknown, Strain D1" /LENGTH=296 /DNA_ID=CAMNT_0016455693 /DNA_START=26 /DNA_END=913 /DNA_ORIENTATION=-